MGQKNSQQGQSMSRVITQEEINESKMGNEKISTTEEWVQVKNSNPGPPILEKAIKYAQENGQSELFGEIQPLNSLPHVPPDLIALVIPSVLSREECDTIIKVVPFEGQGYLSPEDIKMLYRDRVVHRYITNDPSLSRLIFQRIQQFIPSELDGGEFVDISPSWRFLRYELGGHQASHLDGRENSPIPSKYSKVQSRLTIQMYLNDHRHHHAEGYQGGEMVFYQSDGETVRHIHYPSAGDCLLFFQEAVKNDIWEFELIHEAKSVTEGVKYAMRTVVDYGW